MIRFSNSFITANIILLGFFISTGTAIQCWECNSKTDPGCLDPFNSYSLGSVNCSQADSDVEHLRDDGKLVEARICRKTVQIVEEELRVIRGCGWIKNEGSLEGRECFSRVGTMGVTVKHCSCHTDGCNGVGKTEISHPIFVVLPSFLALFISILTSWSTIISTMH